MEDGLFVPSANLGRVLPRHRWQMIGVDTGALRPIKGVHPMLFGMLFEPCPPMIRLDDAVEQQLLDLGSSLPIRSFSRI